MPEYVIGYHIYGPVRVQVSGEIGEAVLKKKSSESPEDAILEFQDVSAPDEEKAEELANQEYRRKAQNIVNTLSYIIEDGMVLGESREVKEQSGDRMYLSSHTVLKPFVLEIANLLLQSSSNLEENEDLQHSLTWYSIGQGTYTPEDRLLAFWTGLEAQVETQDVLNDDELTKYRDVVSCIEDELEDYGELRKRAKSLLGLLKKESHKVAVKRYLGDTFDNIGDELDEIDEIWTDRGGIVHSGVQIEEASEKADLLKELLRRVIDRQLSQEIENMVSFDLPLDLTDESGEPYTVSSPTTAPEEWLRVVFDGEIGKTLSIDEIQLRAYPIFRNIREVARLERILDKMVGWKQPLRKEGENEYSYSPPPEWFSPEVDAVLRYLKGAGEVTPQIISHNLPNVRNDVELSSEETEEVCERLSAIHLVEQIDDCYYKLTVNGEGCLDGRMNPRDFG